VVLIYGKSRKELSGGYRLTTNNRMEILAAIKGLEALKEPCAVTIYSDSEYLVKAMNLGWVTRWKSRNWVRKKKERALNVDLWECMLLLCQAHQVEFVWVRGHVGNPNNERCDQLAMAALHLPNLLVDEGYESAK
jgi:ribonuclease HI